MKIAIDPTPFERLIEKYGLRRSWIYALATHVKESAPRFHYILESPLFSKAKFLPQNHLSNLTIGEIGVLYEYSVALSDPESRRGNGQFFTPDDVAIFMTQQTHTFRP
jgi:hypothetical protein